MSATPTNGQVPPGDPGTGDAGARERGEFLSYVWGAALALLLTLAAFGMVHWGGAPRTTVLYTIGALGLVQMIVHFRLFLHIGIKQQREDLHLILFSALLLAIMIGGTVWIMTSLAYRMAMR
ncbi:MAG: cytochrome o ubiquinol oxidase subunit IV [Steroidobacteraceae bacterium]